MITTEFILMSAIIVFLLMAIGIILSVREFEHLVDESAKHKKSHANAERSHYSSRQGNHG